MAGAWSSCTPDACRAVLRLWCVTANPHGTESGGPMPGFHLMIETIRDRLNSVAILAQAISCSKSDMTAVESVGIASLSL